jgi:hypothetical protein
MRLPYSLIVAALFVVPASAEPLRLHPENPRYFDLGGRAAVLVTSGEHYGAVLNQDFDFVKYLDTLAADGLNLTRLFVGSYVEKPGDFGIRFNTLAPAPGRLLAPWARSDKPGYAGGGNRFDLERWDDAYFARLRDFLTQAQARGIVVELVMFSDWYGRGDYSPMHPANHVNGLEGVTADNAHTLDNHGLLAYQEALVRKVVRETNEFDLLYYEIQNEPYASGKIEHGPIHPYVQPSDFRQPGAAWVNRVDLASAASLAWQREVAGWIASEEAGLSRRHLIAQNYANFRYPLEDVDERVSVLNFHYGLPEAVTLNAGWNRPVGFDESGFAGRDDSLYRRLAWRFMMAGGAVFDGLDYSFAVGFETGRAENTAPGGGSAALRSQLGVLRRTLHELDLAKAQPRPGIVAHAPGAFSQALAVDGDAYLVYLEGPGRTTVALAVPPGRYRATWINTRTGRIERQEDANHRGTRLTLDSPEYLTDIALRLVRIGR